MKKVLHFLLEELKEVLPATIFFLFGFHMVALTKDVLLSEYAITASGASVATVGALIVAKAILIMDKLPLAEWFCSRRIYNIGWRTLLFGATAVAFRLVEELIAQAGTAGDVAAAASTLFAEIDWARFWVMQMWLFGLLFLYCTLTELVSLAGAPRVRRALFGSA